MQGRVGQYDSNVCTPLPTNQPTSYGALYVASPLYVYGWPLGLWVEVIQFTRENKHGCQNKTLGTAYFLLKTSCFKDREDEQEGVTVSDAAMKKGVISIRS